MLRPGVPFVIVGIFPIPSDSHDLENSHSRLEGGWVRA